ncbi:MAG: hypothetical protein R3E96_09390 [Planctomycetota bacterium]
MLCFIPLLFLFASPAGDEDLRPLDTVAIAGSKSKLEGRVVRVAPEEIVVRVKSKLESVPRGTVAEYTSVNENLMSLMDQLAAAPNAENTEGLQPLAESCETLGLRGEARLVWWSILRLEPTNEEANKALGNRKVKKKWQTRMGTRWKDVADLFAEKPKWGDAYELQTTHFNIKSGLPWGETVRGALLAEEMYVDLYRSFAGDFGLYWSSEICDLIFYAGEGFEGGGEVRALTDVDARRVSLDFAAGIELWLMGRYVSELLIYQAVREMGAAGRRCRCGSRSECRRRCWRTSGCTTASRPASTTIRAVPTATTSRCTRRRRTRMSSPAS